jgi:hypothetical protein
MRYLILILSVLVLTACSETIMLTKPGGEAVATGTLKFRPNPPHLLTVTLNGKTYEGEIDSKKVENRAELFKRFGSDSRHYQRIFSSLDTDHNVYQHKGILKAADGAILTCEYLSSKERGISGACEDGKGQAYEVHEQAVK